jgi:hypothetical protein
MTDDLEFYNGWLRNTTLFSESRRKTGGVNEETEADGQLSCLLPMIMNTRILLVAIKVTCFFICYPAQGGV